MFKDCSAVELADLLEGMTFHPHNTGGLSMLDEATLAFGRESDQIRQAQHAFSLARHAHKRSWDTAAQQYGDQAWEEAIDAARRLATLLRGLGDTCIARCQRPAGWGTCGLPLGDDGKCRSSLGHSDGDK